MYSSLNLDIIKNIPDFLESDNMQNYYYQLTDIVSFENSTVYAVSFKQKETIKVPLFKGTLYINTKNFALIGAEFEYNMKYYTRNNLNFVAKKSRKFKITPNSAKYFVSYKKINKKYIFNYIRADLVFKVRKKNNLFTSKYETSFEAVGLNCKTDNIQRFNKKETLKHNSIFIDNNYEYDTDFWGKYNTIYPEKGIIQALKNIHLKINLIK